MAYTRPKHYIYQAFCELAKREHLTTAELIQRLQTMFPFEPVESIVRAEDEAAAHQGQAEPDDFNAAIRARAARNGAHTVELPRSALTGIANQPEYNPADDFIRQRITERYGQD